MTGGDEAGPFGEEGVGAVGEDDDVGEIGGVLGRGYADTNGLTAVEVDFGGMVAEEEGGAGGDGFGGQPGIEVFAFDGQAVIGSGAEAAAGEAGGDGGVFGEPPVVQAGYDAFVAEFFPEVGEEFVGLFGDDGGAAAGLGAWEGTALEEEHVESVAGHEVGGAGAGRPGADDDGVVFARGRGVGRSFRPRG